MKKFIVAILLVIIDGKSLTTLSLYSHLFIVHSPFQTCNHTVSHTVSQSTNDLLLLRVTVLPTVTFHSM